MVSMHESIMNAQCTKALFVSYAIVIQIFECCEGTWFEDSVGFAMSSEK